MSIVRVRTDGCGVPGLPSHQYQRGKRNPSPRLDTRELGSHSLMCCASQSSNKSIYLLVGRRIHEWVGTLAAVACDGATVVICMLKPSCYSAASDPEFDPTCMLFNLSFRCTWHFANFLYHM